MFVRPIHHLLNPTDGLLADIVECAVDKVGIFNWHWETPPLSRLIQTLRIELHRAEREGKTRVVLIAHAQGTIITGKALEKLGRDAGDPAEAEETRRLMRELLFEVYCIASCAHVMPAENVRIVESISIGCAHVMLAENVRIVESISNGRDTVAYLGQLFPFPSLWRDVHFNAIHIDGPKVKEPLLWGHLLNTHYVFSMWYHNRHHNSRLVREYMRLPGEAGAAINQALLRLE
jgi:hypothetical protein